MTPWKLRAAVAALRGDHELPDARSVLMTNRVRISGTTSAEIVARFWRLWKNRQAPDELASFLEGFPQRYTLTQSPEQIAGHFALARKLAQEPISVELRASDNQFDLTVVTADRPYLFASITGAHCRVGHEYRESGCLRQCRANGSGHVHVRGLAPHTGVEPVGARSVQAELD